MDEGFRHIVNGPKNILMVGWQWFILYEIAVEIRCLPDLLRMKLTSVEFADLEMENAACPNGCPPDDDTYLTGRDRLHDLPGEFTVVRCKTCRLLRTNPRPTANSIGLYYPEDYAPYHVPTVVIERPKTLNLRRKIKAWKNRLLGLEDAKSLPVSPPGRLLEIGCANGVFLAEAAAKGWEVRGIEFSPAAAAAARARGFEVDCGTIEQVVEPKTPYDLITGWMVFEHLHHPEKTFRAICNWVRPGGWLALSVPDAGALEFRIFGPRWYALQVPAHMTHFTASSIRTVLARAGWQVRHIIWHQNPNNFFNSLGYWAKDCGHPKLAQWCKDVVAGRRGRRLHRFLAKWMAITRQSGRMTVWAQRTDLPHP